MQYLHLLNSQKYNFTKNIMISTWAATVCDLVGKSFEIHAVLKPASDRPNAALNPAPPAPTTTASYVWSTTSYSLDIWDFFTVGEYAPGRIWSFLSFTAFVVVACA